MPRPSFDQSHLSPVLPEEAQPMKRAFFLSCMSIALSVAILFCEGTLGAVSSTGSHASGSAERSSAGPSIPATRYYPLAIGNRWDYSFKRVTNFSLTTADGKDRGF